MKIYVNKHKELILASEKYEKFGGIANETMQIKSCEFTKEIEKGIKLDCDATAKPASLEITSPCEGYITVTEGMFHLVKRIFEATGNKVTYLKRTDFGPLSLDSSLPEGRYRFLTDAEVKSLILAQKG